MKKPDLSQSVWVVYNSGLHWTLLGMSLLATSAYATWASRGNPLAVSGIFIADAAILLRVPNIMEQRMRLLGIAQRDCKHCHEQHEGTTPEA